MLLLLPTSNLYFPQQQEVSFNKMKINKLSPLCLNSLGASCTFRPGSKRLWRSVLTLSLAPSPNALCSSHTGLASLTHSLLIIALCTNSSPFLEHRICMWLIFHFPFGPISNVREISLNYHITLGSCHHRIQH